MVALDTLFLAGGQARHYLDESGKFHVQNLCSAVGVAPAAFARLTQRKTESVAGLFSAGFVQPREPRTREILKQLLQIASIFEAMGWTDEDTRRWMRAPLVTFAGQTPAEVLEQGRGQELVSRLIDLATGNIGS